MFSLYGNFLHPTFTGVARLRFLWYYPYAMVTFLTFGNSIWSCDASLARRVVVRFYPARPGSLSASFDIISVLCSDPLLRHHTHQYAHRPLDAHYFWPCLAGIVTDAVSFADASFHGSFMSEPYFPAASIHLHRQYDLRMVIREDSFLKGAVPYFSHKPIALFRRFVILFWNSLFFIAITLIVSVTAPRRVPRTSRMLLLLPLDSPLSTVWFGLTPIPDRSEWVFAVLQGPCLTFFGVCPYLFCEPIISSILHKVKCYFAIFDG